MKNETQAARDERAADEYVNKAATFIFAELDKAGIQVDDELHCHGMSDGFLAGIAHERERLREFILVVGRYYDKSPNDWCDLPAGLMEIYQEFFEAANAPR